MNAIIHRDYALAGNDIKIAIFDDMLEITSPGPLPDTISLEDLGTGRSDIRNRVLAPIFKDLGLIEAWGTGMQKIRQANLKYSEIATVFQEVGWHFKCNSKNDHKLSLNLVQRFIKVLTLPCDGKIEFFPTMNYRRFINFCNAF